MPVLANVVPPTFWSDNQTRALSWKDVWEICCGVMRERREASFFLENALNNSNGNLGSVGLAVDSAGMVPLSNELLPVR